MNYEESTQARAGLLHYRPGAIVKLVKKDEYDNHHPLFAVVVAEQTNGHYSLIAFERVAHQRELAVRDYSNVPIAEMARKEPNVPCEYILPWDTKSVFAGENLIGILLKASVTHERSEQADVKTDAIAPDEKRRRRFVVIRDPDDKRGDSRDPSLWYLVHDRSTGHNVLGHMMHQQAQDLCFVMNRWWDKFLESMG